MAGDVLNIRPADECLRDCAAFGEVMLRFDPGHDRLRNARTFQVWGAGYPVGVRGAIASQFWRWWKGGC